MPNFAVALSAYNAMYNTVYTRAYHSWKPERERETETERERDRAKQRETERERHNRTEGFQSTERTSYPPVLAFDRRKTQHLRKA